MNSVPLHHKEFFRFLDEQFKGGSKVTAYRDRLGRRPVAIFENGKREHFYSTVGMCDADLTIPEGRFELAAMGKNPWLANVLAGSVYWLKGRRVEAWPMVCEDVVRHNAKSSLRHMAFVPGRLSLQTSAGRVQWLLGVPIRDSEIDLGLIQIAAKVQKVFPDWLFTQG